MWFDSVSHRKILKFLVWIGLTTQLNRTIPPLRPGLARLALEFL